MFKNNDLVHMECWRGQVLSRQGPIFKLLLVYKNHYDTAFVKTFNTTTRHRFNLEPYICTCTCFLLCDWILYRSMRFINSSVGTFSDFSLDE